MVTKRRGISPPGNTGSVTRMFDVMEEIRVPVERAPDGIPVQIWFLRATKPFIHPRQEGPYAVVAIAGREPLCIATGLSEKNARVRVDELLRGYGAEDTRV